MRWLAAPLLWILWLLWLGLLALAAPAAAASAYDAQLVRPEASGLGDAFRRFRAYPFFAKGYALARAGDMATAIGWLEQGLARDPGQDEARFNLILLALAAEDAPRAQRHADVLIARRPAFAAAYLLRGLAML
ncbi:MAG: hypothetical protein D6782_05000, partial [Alphaproteobacteria bacterium]